MLQMLKSWFAGDPLDGPARKLYHTIVEQARHPVFYEEFGVPDTANGRFDMIVLHCFCVMQRLKNEPEGFDLSQTLMTVVVDDLDRNLREMGVGDLSVGKKMKRIAEGFYGRLEAYGDGLQGDGATLIAALRRNIYSSVEDPKEDQIAAVGEYFGREVKVVNEMSLEALLRGDLSFGSPMLTISECGR
jgi:cytochrome b pre-mRNA-processing protein 3